MLGCTSLHLGYGAGRKSHAAGTAYLSMTPPRPDLVTSIVCRALVRTEVFGIALCGDAWRIRLHAVTQELSYFQYHTSIWKEMRRSFVLKILRTLSEPYRSAAASPKLPKFSRSSSASLAPPSSLLVIIWNWPGHDRNFANPTIGSWCLMPWRTRLLLGIMHDLIYNMALDGQTAHTPYISRIVPLRPVSIAHLNHASHSCAIQGQRPATTKSKTLPPQFLALSAMSHSETRSGPPA